MKQFLLLNGKELKVKYASIFEDEYTSVTCENEHGSLITFENAKNKSNNTENEVEDLTSKIIDKENSVIKKLEQLFKDEDELRQDIAVEVAEASTPQETFKKQLEYSSQASKVYGIGVALNLAKKTLGYKD